MAQGHACEQLATIWPGRCWQSIAWNEVIEMK